MCNLQCSVIEEPFPLLVQQHPERIDSERGAVRQQQQVDRTQHQREQPAPGLAAPQRRTDADVRGSPDDRDDRQGGERGGGQSRRELPTGSPTACGCDERHGANPERERRQTDEGSQQTPDDEEDADEVNMGIQASPGSRGTDGDPDLDAYGCGMRGSDAEAKPRAVGNTSRHRHPHGVVEERFTRSAAGMAGLGPRFAATTAHRTCPAHRHVQGHDQTPPRFSRGELQLGGQHVGRRPFAEKRLADALDDVPDRGKVDGDLVGKAVLRDTG
jgi:hypothetical protein